MAKRAPTPKPRSRTAARSPGPTRELTPRQARFVDEYLLDLNATQAAIRAGYSDQNADKIGSELLGKTRVAAAIAAAKAARAQRTQITADRVLRKWWAIATADPNELIEMRRVCCRYCHGADHRYQRTRGELETARNAWATAASKAKDDEAIAPFDPQGGDGYDLRLLPHPACPECFGEGVERPFPKDSRLAKGAARLLYAGVKVTKDGLELKMRDQDGALANVAKHLGMFVEHHEHTGKDGGPIETRDAPPQSWQVGDRVISWN